MKPLNGEKTHPLTPHAREVLRCRHYGGGGPDGPNCECGIDLLSYNDGKRSGFIRVLPCWGPGGFGDGNKPAGTCESYSPYTKDEIAKREEQFAAAMEQMLTARASIVEHIQRTGRRADRIVCPVCVMGILAYSQASVNDHIHAACTTTDCVRWME